MNFLAWKDIQFNPLRFLVAAFGVGFLLTGCIVIVGLYRGIVHDALFTINAIGAELWVVEGGRAGPFAEPSVVPATLDRRAEGIPGVRAARRFVQNAQQFALDGRTVRISVTGLDLPKDHGDWLNLCGGRLIQASHYEAIADESLGIQLGQVIRLGHDDYRIVGMTRGQVDSFGDGMLFVAIQDALDIADTRPSETVLLDRPQGFGWIADHPTRLSAVVVSLDAAADAGDVMRRIAAWGDVSVLTAEQERDALVNGRLQRLRLQILFFAVLMLTVTGVVIAMTVYNNTVEKLHQIAMLRLIGAHDRFILAMIMQQAMLIGGSAFVVALSMGYLISPSFPRHLEFLPGDLAMIFCGLMLGCIIGSWFGISRALRVRAKEVLS